MSDIVKELKDLSATVKSTRARAIAELREMTGPSLRMLVNGLRRDKEALERKVHHYPGDLTLKRLADLLGRKKELGL